MRDQYLGITHSWATRLKRFGELLWPKLHEKLLRIMQKIFWEIQLAISSSQKLFLGINFMLINLGTVVQPFRWTMSRHWNLCKSSSAKILLILCLLEPSLAKKLGARVLITSPSHIHGYHVALLCPMPLGITLIAKSMLQRSSWQSVETAQIRHISAYRLWFKTSCTAS